MFSSDHFNTVKTWFSRSAFHSRCSPNRCLTSRSVSVLSKSSLSSRFTTSCSLRANHRCQDGGGSTWHCVKQRTNYCHLLNCVFRGKLYDAIKRSSTLLSDWRRWRGGVCRCRPSVFVQERRGHHRDLWRSSSTRRRKSERKRSSAETDGWRWCKTAVLSAGRQTATLWDARRVHVCVRTRRSNQSITSCEVVHVNMTSTREETCWWTT